MNIVMEDDISKYLLHVSYMKDVGDVLAHPVVTIHHTGCRCTTCALNAKESCEYWTSLRGKGGVEIPVGSHIMDSL